MRDTEHGGWYSAVGHEPDDQGRGVPADPRGRKECYQHAFVLLAAAAATAADRPGAHELLRDAMAVQNRYWWDEEYGLPVESFAYDFSDPEDYRGINAAMHTVEAYLATADVTGDLTWLARAVQIIDFAVNVQARANDWRLPEHYDAHWRPDLDYNKDQPAHPFRPYGVTPGHGLEWARLTVQARAALVARSLPVPDWMLDAAEELFDRARTDGWRVDGGPGFVYTTDFGGTPPRPCAARCSTTVAARSRSSTTSTATGAGSTTPRSTSSRRRACGSTSSIGTTGRPPVRGRGIRTSTTPCRRPSWRVCPCGPRWDRPWRRGAWTSPRR